MLNEWLFHIYRVVYGSLKVLPDDEVNQEANTRRREKESRRRVEKRNRRGETTKRRDPRSRHVDFIGTRKQSIWLGREDKNTRSWISSSRLHEEGKTRRRNIGSRQVDFIKTRRQEHKLLDQVKSSWFGREDKILDLVKSTLWGRKRREDQILDIVKSTNQDEKMGRQDHWSCHVDFMRMRRRDLTCKNKTKTNKHNIMRTVHAIYLISRLKVHLTRSGMRMSSCLLILIKSTLRNPAEDFIFLSSRPDEVDLTIFSISSSHLFILMNLTWRDQGPYLLVFSSSSVNLTRSRHLSSRPFILIMSNWWDPGSCLLNSHPHQVDLTRSKILFSCLLVLKK